MSQFTATQASYLMPNLRRVILNHHVSLSCFGFDSCLTFDDDQDDWLPGFTAPRFDVGPIVKAVSEKTNGKVETLELPYVSSYELFAGLDREKL
jgi:hypothetical protein